MFTRFLALLSFLLFATQGFAGQDNPQKWCAPNSEYSLAEKANVSDLRLSLYMISQISKNKNNKSVKPFLEDIADASLFSLANVLSLRADFVQNCSLEQDAYYNEMAANERFIPILQQVIRAGNDFSIQQEELFKLYEKHPEYFFGCGHGCVGLKEGNGSVFRFDKKITKRLKAWERHGKSINDPVVVAASLLLGKQTRWSEHTLVPIAIFRLSPQGMELANMDSMQFYGKIETIGSASILRIISEYYTNVSRK